MFWSFLPGMISYGIKNIAIWFAFLWAKPYLVIGISLFLGILGMKFLNGILGFFKGLIETQWGRWLLIGSIIFGAGGVVGWKFHPNGPKIQVVNVQKADMMLRGKGIIYEGNTYYSSNMINKYLELKKSPDRFKNISP